MKENILIIKENEKVNLNGVMGLFLKEYFTMENQMEKEL
jgi:hypothetical protein